MQFQAQQQQCGEQDLTPRRSAATSTTTAAAAAESGAAHAPQGPQPIHRQLSPTEHITATPVHRGDAGAPTITFPIPDGWADAGPDTPATAYWAIVDKGPEAAKYTPSIVATVSKLVGNVDQQKLLDLASGELKNLPGFTPMGDGIDHHLRQFSWLPIRRQLDARRPDESRGAEVVVISIRR